MIDIVNLFNKVKNTAGSNDKKAILKENMSDLLKMIFMDTYGPQKYHVTKKSLEGIEFRKGLLTIENGYKDFHNDLVRLSNKEVSGKSAVALLAGMIDCFTLDAQEILLAIIDRNLKIGVSFDNFNSILDDKIEKYDVPLAFNIKDVKNVDPIDGTYFASRKLDGVRCEAHINNYWEDGKFIQEVVFKSRVGKEYKTLDNLKEAVKKFTTELIGQWVLDGECCITDENDNEDFSGIMKEITRKNHTIKYPRYKLFDIVPQQVFDKMCESSIYEVRLHLLQTLQNHADDETKQFIQVLPQELLTTQEQFDKWVELVKENGWEGFMLHKNELYRRGRTKDLLKVKKFKDAEFIVKEVKNGKVTYNENGAKEYDAVSSLVIEFKDNTVDVGSGLSKEQRLRWFEHPEEIIGKTITVQYFEETRDVKTGLPSLRFPVLKYVYENGRNV